ncbi:MAG: hypothetical protein M1829_006544 [Trizodia sp. TS-e1964]|nr:MAG: hypothetical protein M1829_006544 [Trizodia sp. TS-e1964]
MASHQLAIAKASLAAGFLRPDPKPVSRDEINKFHSLLESTISQCSPGNVQNCKRWLLENVTPSSARITAFGKYLFNLSKSYDSLSQKGASPAATSKPSTKRKRLHMLYLINDLLHHTKSQGTTYPEIASLTSKLQPSLVDLFTAVASFLNCPKHQKKIVELLSIWEENAYYSKSYIEKLRETVQNAASHGSPSLGNKGDKQHSGHDGIASTEILKKDAPFVVPASHGDPYTPYYDLPAANMMPHIIPNSSKPINPQLVKALQFVAGPADESLTAAVKSFLKDIDGIFSEDSPKGVLIDIDEFGQPILQNKTTGELSSGTAYYGWSRSFCEKMKRDRGYGKRSTQAGMRGRDADSRSRSTSQRKRRRYSSSYRSRSRSRSESRSKSPSRSRSGRRSWRDKNSRSRSPNRSRGRRRSRSYSPQARHSNSSEEYPRRRHSPAPYSKFRSSSLTPSTSSSPGRYRDKKANAPPRSPSCSRPYSPPMAIGFNQVSNPILNSVSPNYEQQAANAQHPNPANYNREWDGRG